MTERIVVETKCPQCGAPLDFSEATHAVRCGHCRTALLVTGRKQLLSFWIRPRIGREAAIEAAVPGAATAAEAHLVFLPYYRFTADDLLWKARERAVAPREKAPMLLMAPSPYDFEDPDTRAERDVDMMFGLVEAAFSSIDWMIDRVEDAAAALVGKSVPEEREEEIPPVRVSAKPAAPGEAKVTSAVDWGDAELDGRRLERNFLALAISRPALFSIGVRASVLRLELFHRETVRALGWIAPVSLPPQEAMSRALRAPGKDVLYRTTVAQALSLIWFPYWFVSSNGGQATVVDSVAGSVVERGFPADLLADLMKEMGLELRTIGFRPLTCPNCGWDLPLREEDTAFFCDSCGRAWQIERSDLTPIEAEFMEGEPPRPGDEIVYLPFWTVSGRSGEGEIRYFVPAFAYRGLLPVHRLAAMLTQRQPTWTAATEVPPGEKIGCIYDRTDGVRIAQFLHAWSQMRRGMAAEEVRGLSVTRAVLTWIPFARRGAMLFDPFLGANLYANLIGG